AVADQMVPRRDDSGKRGAYGSPVDLRQDGVEGRALPVAGDEDGNIVLIGSRMPGLAAPFTRCARQVGPPDFAGFEDEGFVRFDDTAQRARLVGGGARRNRCRQRKAASDERRTVARSWPGSCLRSSRARARAISPSCADAPSASWSAR